MLEKIEQIHELLNIPNVDLEPENAITNMKILNLLVVLRAEAKQLILSSVMQWVAVKDELPPILKTIWLSNGKGWTDLGCRVETNEGWHWAGQNGIIYQEKDQIVAECESDDLDVVYWCKLPKPPCA